MGPKGLRQRPGQRLLRPLGRRIAALRDERPGIHHDIGDPVAGDGRWPGGRARNRRRLRRVAAGQSRGGKRAETEKRDAAGDNDILH